MKVLFRKIFYTAFIIGFFSCESEYVKEAFARVEVNSNELEINESVEFIFTGIADQVVVYTGDSEHNFDLLSEYNTGVVMNKNKLTYAYKQPGVYKVVFVASCYGNMGKGLNRDTCSVVINVVDDNVEIDQISCPQIVYDEVFAKKINDEWLMLLPRKIIYNNREVSISTSQRIKITLASDSSKVIINDVGYSSTGRYDLANPLNIKVTSYNGNSKTHQLFMLYYPEFNSIKVLNHTGTIIRNEFAYDDLRIRFRVPFGTDLSNIVPVFSTTSPTDKVYIDNQEQISGLSAVDFTKKTVYSIVSEVPINTHMKAVTNFTVEVVFE